MDFLYNDYASFKMDNEELIKELVNTNFLVTSRFSHVYDVVEFIYKKRVDQIEVTSEEEEIFNFGFDYLFDQFELLNSLVSEYYKSYQELERHYKTVNLLANIIDYEKEVDIEDEASIKKYRNLENKVYEYIKKGEEAPIELFGILDDINYVTLGDDFKDVSSIFLEIASEYDLVDQRESTFDIDKLV